MSLKSLFIPVLICWMGVGIAFGQCPGPDCPPATEKYNAYEADRRYNNWLANQEAANRNNSAGSDLGFLIKPGIGLVVGSWLLNELNRSAGQTSKKCIDGNCVSGEGIQMVRKDYITYLYKGSFSNGKYHGIGSYYYLNGSELELLVRGNYVNGQPSGLGLFYDFNVRIEKEGFFTRGTLTRTGTYYIGNLTSSGRNGWGMTFDAEHRMLYEGEWMSDRKHGYGKEYYPNGQLKSEGQYSLGAETGAHKIYNPDGSLKFNGRLWGVATKGEGTYYYGNGEYFIGKWAYLGRNFRGASVKGKVKNEKGKTIKRLRINELYPCDMRYFLRGIVLPEVTLIGTMGDKHRFEGVSRAYIPDGWFWGNHEFKLSVGGPRIFKWNKLFLHGFYNSRVYRFPNSENPYYVPTVLFDNPPDSSARFTPFTNPDEDETDPIMLRNIEIGAGAYIMIPITRQTSIDLGGGVIAKQWANLEHWNVELPNDEHLYFSSQKSRNVLNYSKMDYYAETGIHPRRHWFRIYVRTYFRNPVSTNSSFPLFVKENDEFVRYPIRENQKLSIRPQLNVSFQFPVAITKNKLAKHDRWLPKVGAKE